MDSRRGLRINFKDCLMETVKVGNLPEVNVVDGNPKKRKLEINADVDKLKEVE